MGCLPNKGTLNELHALDAVGDDAGKVELKSKFVELRAKGHSYAKIAKQLKVAKSTLANWNQELEEDIASLKAMELEALQEQYYLLKEGRIRFLGEQIKAIQEELKRRDLSKVSTEKLLELQLRYYDDHKKDFVESRPLSDGEKAELQGPHKYKIGTKMNSGDIAKEIFRALRRYRAGIINTTHAGRELAFLQVMLKAEDQAELQGKLEKLESILEGRK